MTAAYADAATGSAPDADEALVEGFDAAVRALVRRDGVDPQRDATVVRRIAQEVVRDHDERSLTGLVAPLADPGAMVSELVSRVSGFGPLQPFLDDPTVEEVWINSPDRVFVARNGRNELTNLVLTPALVQELTERMLKSSGRRVDVSRPFVDAMLPDGHRLHVVLEGISRGFTAIKTAYRLPIVELRDDTARRCCRHAHGTRHLRPHLARSHTRGSWSPTTDRGVPRTRDRARLARAAGLFGQRHLGAIRQTPTRLRTAACRHRVRRCRRPHRVAP
jgi:hypothetical protein